MFFSGSGDCQCSKNTNRVFQKFPVQCSSAKVRSYCCQGCSRESRYMYCTGYLTVCLSPGWPHGYCTCPQSEPSGFEHRPGVLPLSTWGYKWVNWLNCCGNLHVTNYRRVTCNVPASHPGGVEILLSTSYYKNRDKL